MEKEEMEMPLFYLQISSVTHAYRGQRLLESRGIPAAVQRDSRFASARGCGYQIRVRNQDPGAVRSLLVQSGIRVLGIKDGDGNDIV